VAKSHGRVAVLKLDDLDGVLTDISTYCDQASFQPSADRPETQTFGQGAKRREVLGLRDGGTISVQGFFVPASSKLHGRTTKLLVDEFDVSAYFDQATIRRTCDLSETQTFGDDWKERGVPGLVDGSMSVGGFFDSAAGGADAIVRSALADADGQVVTRGYSLAIGSLVDVLQAAETNFDESVNENEVNRLSAEFVADGYVDLGVSLHDLSAETATGQFAPVNESENTTGGGIGTLHVTAFGGSGSPTISILHSTSTSTSAVLGTFTAITAVGAQRLTVSGAVKKILRARIDTAGSVAGGITFHTSFARRGFAYGTAGTYRHWCGMLQTSGSQSFELGPEGGTSGKRKISGEARLSSLEVAFNENEVTRFSADLMADSTVTFGTF